MKVLRITIFAVVAAILGIATTASAQDTTSPYSKFGYGLLRDNATSAQRAMGGVGYAMNSGRQINVMNPASYASIDTLTFLFDIGVTLSNQWSDDNGNKLRTTGGGLDYITMQFPLGKYMGGSFGLLPYSSVGYSFGSTIDHGLSTRYGEGGLNQLYLGVSGRPFKGFSIGANVAYLFGSTFNNIYVTSDIGSRTMFSQQMDVRDFHIELGAQYTLNFNEKSSATVGLVFSPGKTLLGTAMITTSEYKSGSSGDYYAPVDSVLPPTAMKGMFSLPSSWGFGISYKYDRQLLLEADFTYQNWKNAKFLNVSQETIDANPNLQYFTRTRFDNRWKIALGAQYVPAVRGNYLKLINYRAGFFYNHDYVMVGDNNVREWGASIGFGLPAPGRKTMINLSLEYHNRQAHPQPLLKEDYLNITLGINFNEVWFWQNKIR